MLASLYNAILYTYGFSLELVKLANDYKNAIICQNKLEKINLYPGTFWEDQTGTLCYLISYEGFKEYGFEEPLEYWKVIKFCAGYPKVIYLSENTLKMSLLAWKEKHQK